MNLPGFVNSLLYDGNIVVSNFAPIPQQDVNVARKIIVDFEKEFRDECPPEIPELQLDSATWAGIVFFRACQFAMYRDIDEQTIDAEFKRLETPHGTAASHYSVHLFFRFLSDLTRLSAAFSSSDPLGEHILNWATEWPLSSVGIDGVKDVKTEAVLSNQGLMSMYVDRIIQMKDESRISSSKIRDRVCIALGAKDSWTKQLVAKEFTA